MIDAPGFTGSPLDRADRLRHDPDALARATDWRARLLVLGPGYEPQVGDDGRLSWTSLAAAPDGAELALLGLADGRAHFAAITGERGGAAFRSPRVMSALATLQPGDAATWGAARSLLDWHARHRFCANCGAGTALFRAGWGRQCPACSTEHFPRTDPVVIMVAEHRGRALVGRQAAWPAGRYSALAGFLEPGESIEEAVARELHEEAGVRVRDVRYVASQPWPFPSQLMIACTAAADEDAITLDGAELEAAMWVTPGEVRAALAGDAAAPFVAPPPYAIAHTLLRRWAAGPGAA